MQNKCHRLPSLALVACGAPLLSMLLLFAPRAAADSSPVCAAEGASVENAQLFSAFGKTYSANDLTLAQKQAAYEAELARYESLKGVVDAFLLDNFIADEMRNSKKSREEVERALFTSGEPTEADTKAWFEKNKDRIPYEYEKIKGEIAKVLKNEQSGQKRTAIIARLKEQGKFKLLLATPQAPQAEIATTGFPAKGNPAARVKIVEFADYQCGHCRAAFKIMKEVVERMHDSVLFTYMDFPLHGEEGASFEHAVAAVCADEQGKYWEFHDDVFTEPKLDASTPMTIAKKLGLDEKRFASCLNSDGAHAKVKKAYAEGVRLGISGTPSIYVNGKKISGYSPEVLTAEINAILGVK